jgi:hypothetical protein
MKKKIWASFQRIIEIFTQKFATKLSKIWVWDPGSGKNLFRILDPGPGVKKAPDPGSATLQEIRLRNTALLIYVFMTVCVCRTGARTSTGCVPRAEAGPPTMECENFTSSYCCSWRTFPAPPPLTRHTQHSTLIWYSSSRKILAEFCRFPCLLLRPRFIIHLKSILLLLSPFCVFFRAGNGLIQHLFAQL